MKCLASQQTQGSRAGGVKAVSCMCCCQDESVLTTSSSSCSIWDSKPLRRVCDWSIWVTCLTSGWAGEGTRQTVPRRGRSCPQRKMRRVTGRSWMLDWQWQPSLSCDRLLSPSSSPHHYHCRLTNLCPNTTWGPQRKTEVKHTEAYEQGNVLRWRHRISPKDQNPCHNRLCAPSWPTPAQNRPLRGAEWIRHLLSTGPNATSSCPHVFYSCHSSAFLLSPSSKEHDPSHPLKFSS